MKKKPALKNFNFLLNKYRKKSNKYVYPILDDAFSNKDLIEGIKVILSGQLTMSDKTFEFEKVFEEWRSS